jgi:hypothetical protein
MLTFWHRKTQPLAQPPANPTPRTFEELADEDEALLAELEDIETELAELEAQYRKLDARREWIAAARNVIYQEALLREAMEREHQLPLW